MGGVIVDTCRPYAVVRNDMVQWRPWTMAMPERGRIRLSSSSSAKTTYASKNRTKAGRRAMLRCTLLAFAFAFALVEWRHTRTLDSDTFHNRAYDESNGATAILSMFRVTRSPSPSPPPPPPPLTTFVFETKRTPSGPNGGPKEYGNVHPLGCGPNGALTKFSFVYDKEEDEIHNEYTCAVAKNRGPTGADAMPPPLEKTTEHGPSGSKLSGRDAMYDMDRHVVDCGNQFLRQWVLHQWSHSMQITYECAWRTSNAGGCERRRQTTEIPRAKKASEWADVELACTSETFLSAFRYVNGTFMYTCCPRPY